jgi:hypothetical protein
MRHFGWIALDLTLGNSYSPFLVAYARKNCLAMMWRARVAELADALDLGSSGQPWGFESPLSHQNAVLDIIAKGKNDTNKRKVD